MSTIDWIVLLLQHTPTWVFPLIGAVLAFAVYNLWTREIPARRLLVFPLVMLGLSLSNAIGTSAPPAVAAALWTATAGLGALLGWVVTGAPLRIDPAPGRLTVAGSAVPLVITVAIVVLRYAFGYTYGRHPELRADMTLALELIAAGAFLTGVTFGRYGRLGWRYLEATRRAPA